METGENTFVQRMKRRASFYGKELEQENTLSDVWGKKKVTERNVQSVYDPITDDQKTMKLKSILGVNASVNNSDKTKQCSNKNKSKEVFKKPAVPRLSAIPSKASNLIEVSYFDKKNSDHINNNALGGVTNADIKIAPFSTDTGEECNAPSIGNTSTVSSITRAIGELDEEIANLQFRLDADEYIKNLELKKRRSTLNKDLKSLPTNYNPVNLFPNYNQIEKHDRSAIAKSHQNKEVSELPLTIDTSAQSSKSVLGKRSLEAIINLNTPRCWKPKSNLEITKTMIKDNFLKENISSRSEHAPSSITPFANTPIGFLENKANKKEDDLDKRIPHEVETFLYNALGDEYLNSSTQSFSVANDENEKENVTMDLQNEPSLPINKSHFRVKFENITFSALRRNPNEAFDRNQMTYRSFTEKLKNRLSRSPKGKSFHPNLSLPVSPNRARSDDKVEQLLQEIGVQQAIMLQANKALQLCHTIKEFEASEEQVESERSLLKANLQMKAIMDEIQRIKEGVNDLDELTECGEIILKDFSFKLREDILRKERHGGRVIEWFILVISRGLNIWVSKAVQCPIFETRLNILEHLTIPNVTSDFKICVQIYSLKLEQTSVFNHEVKYRIPVNERRMSCPSPKKLIQKMKRPNSKWRDVRISNSTKSSFVLAGFIELNLSHLTKKSPWPLHSMLDDTALQDTVDFAMFCKVNLSTYHDGFLTHGCESGESIVWNRRWCILEGHTLMFWNYPQQEERTEPLLIIDLINCSTNQVNTADRSICAKPRTVLIKTVEKDVIDESISLDLKSSYKIIRNFLFFDTIQDLMDWSLQINRVLSSLNDWNARLRVKPSDI